MTGALPRKNKHKNFLKCCIYIGWLSWFWTIRKYFYTCLISFNFFLSWIAPNKLCEFAHCTPLSKVVSHMHLFRCHSRHLLFTIRWTIALSFFVLPSVFNLQFPQFERTYVVLFIFVTYFLILKSNISEIFF